MGDTTSIKLPGELKDKIALLASECEQTPHAYMVEAIAEKVARDERRRDLYEAARKSSAEFERTGVLYTFTDVARYVTGIAAGKKPAKPKPVKRKR